MNGAGTCALLWLIAGSSFCRADWEHYQPILARSPFGHVAAEEAQPVVKTVESDVLARLYRLCAIYEGADGLLRAGVVSRTSDRSTSLVQGEMDQGLELIEVHFDTGEALLRQNGEQAWLTLQGVAFTGTPINRLADPAANTSPQNGAGPEGTPVSVRSMGSRARLVRRSNPKPEPAELEAPALDGSAGSAAAPNNRRVASNVSNTARAVGGRTPVNYSIQSVSRHLQEKFKGRL